MRAAIEGRDTLALMPTGSGKSLTYQLAAMLRPEPTLVLSPLIALMKDQVDKLPPQIARDGDVRQLVVVGRGERCAAREGRVGRDQARLRGTRASPAGAFRRDAPNDRNRARRGGRGSLREHVGPRLPTGLPLHPPRARGARRSDDPRDDGDRDAGDRTRDRSRAGPRRPRSCTPRSCDRIFATTSLSVANAEDRLHILVERLRRLRGGSAIVYARSRRSTEEVARVLRGHGFRAEHYHAGLESEERTRVQDDFVTGRTQAVVATTAFGMGIDKPDVRLVCLVNYPDSLEGYVQMVGRAGRDGVPSETLLLASPSDAVALRRFAVSDVPRTVRSPRDLPSAAGRRPKRRSRRARRRSLPERDPRVLVGMLEQAGLVRRGFDDGRRMNVELLAVPDDAAIRVESLLARARLVAESRADRIIAFAETRACRHAQVAEHFGEQFVPPCGTCDVCAPLAETSSAIAPGAAPARGRGRGDRRRRRRSQVADRATQPRRHALRIPESASVRAKLTRIPLARCGDGGGREALGAAPRARGSAASSRRHPTGSACSRPTRMRRAPRSERERRRRTSTKASRRACAPGASSARGRTAFPRTSSCTTRRCRSSRPFDRRPTASSPASRGSGRSSSSATRTTCSPS